MNNETHENLQNVLTEKDLMDWLEMNRQQIGRLRREKRLPFIKLNDRCRLYFESDLIKFFKEQRVI